MTKKILSSALTAVLALSFGSCKPSGPSSTVPDFVPNPTAISFSACPTRDENGGAVQDVFPDVKKLLINNQGRVSGELGLSLSGAGASSFKLGSDLPTSIDRLTEVEIPISFSPTAKGDVRAELLIDDKTDDTMNPVVTLIGTGINLPAQPSIETAPQKGDKSGFQLCTADSPLSDCELAFPDTLTGQSATLQLKIRNKGCPALKITDLKIEGITNQGSTDGFTVEGVAPSTVSPIVLSTADGTDETVINIRFDATDDGSGSTSQTHYAVLSIMSNDPTFGGGLSNPARISLSAAAIKPSIYVSPTSCNYSNTMDACGNASRIANKASFRVTNDGNTAISISSVKFRSSGSTTSSDSRFSVTQNIQGQTLQPTNSATIEVTEVDQPLLVNDQLEIVADIPGMGAGSGGTVVVSVISGIKPCLVTEPGNLVDFGSPTEEFTARRVLIKNGAGCGTLRIDGVNVKPHMPTFFTMLEPFVTPGTQLAAGGSAEVTVQYRRPASGGNYSAELQIATNDTDYGAPTYKILILNSATPLDQVPTAVLTACSPAQLINDSNCTLGPQSNAAFSLAMVNPDEITLSGANSTDDGTIAEYRFSLLPGGIMSPTALQNNGVRQTSNKTKLTVPAGFTGPTRVSLEVWDNRGQKSPNPNVMTLTFSP